MKEKNNWKIINRDGASAEIYCDDCEFLFNVNQIKVRIDNKWFCPSCLSKNSKKLEEPNTDFCSFCGFKLENEYRIGVISTAWEGIKRRDDHWFHKKCVSKAKI